MLKSLSTELKAAGYLSQEQYDVIQLFRSKNPAESSIGPLLAVASLNEQQVQTFIMQRTRAAAAPKNLSESLERLNKERCPLSTALLQHFEVIPLQWDEQILEVAVSDPLNRTRMAQIEFLSDRKITFRVATQSAITQSLQKFFPNYKPNHKLWEHLKFLAKQTSPQPTQRANIYSQVGRIQTPFQASPASTASSHDDFFDDVDDEMISPNNGPVTRGQESDQDQDLTAAATDPEQIGDASHVIEEIVSMGDDDPFATPDAPLPKKTNDYTEDSPAEFELEVGDDTEPMVDTTDLADDLFSPPNNDESELVDDDLQADTDLNLSDIATDSPNQPDEAPISDPSVFEDPISSSPVTTSLGMPANHFAQLVSRLNLASSRLPVKLNSDNLNATLQNIADLLEQPLILALSQQNEELSLFITNFPDAISEERIRDEISDKIVMQWNSGENFASMLDVDFGSFTSLKATFVTDEAQHICLLMPWNQATQDSPYINDLLMRLSRKIFERYEFF